MIRFRVFRALLTSLFLVASASTLLFAQDTTSLNGRVTDSTGAVIAGASVKVTLLSTGAVREITTDNSGQYQFSQLAPGRYTLSVCCQRVCHHRRKPIWTCW